MNAMRLPPPGPLSPRQQEVSDAIARRRGGVGGPFLIWLRSPDLCEKVEALGAYCLSDDSALPLRLRELALLVAARHWDAQHSWNAHLDKAIAAGVDAGALARLAAGGEPDFPGQDERVLYQLATQLLGRHFVCDDTFDAALAAFGERGLVDLIGALGNFSMQAMLLNVVHLDLEPDREPPFPDITGFGRR
jgi:4-carboxymuconolactone decarboxylase